MRERCVVGEAILNTGRWTGGKEKTVAMNRPIPFVVDAWERKTILWALDAMRDYALDPEEAGYTQDDLPTLGVHDFLFQPNRDVIEDLIYRVKIQLVDMAHEAASERVKLIGGATISKTTARREEQKCYALAQRLEALLDQMPESANE